PTLIVAARTHGDRFEIPDSGAWRPFYVRGVNLGVALPGRFPAEFPTDSGLYAGWLDTLSGMHANAVRLYTILPPSFYRALRGWNLTHPDRALWLVHGVWTELPPEDDFDDPEWKGNFQQEMRRVVDLIHGAADLPVRPGHAGGRYDADVSPWTLAYILGREWEPYAVTGFDARSPGGRPYRGRFLEVADGPAMDAWMAQQCDYLLSYEVDGYNAIRPIAYANWPSLDPLRHPTESTAEEERHWRREPKEAVPTSHVSHEEDAIGLDANLVRPTPGNPAGWFASYHAYPYYPDFLNHDPGYLQARSSEGPSNYFGYLRDLKTYLDGIPLLIAEYGVPSSRGIAHLQPQGRDHGGHDETAMAAIDARLTREIRESGAAGGIVFAWIDEWFKKNWVVANYEIPASHTPRWHNVMDAEQNYGILGQYAGEAGASPVLGGDPARWLGLTSLEGPAQRPRSGTASGIRIGQDESYVYLALPVAASRGRPFRWDTFELQIALDTFRPDLGQHSLVGGDVASDLGFEFLIILRGPGDAEIRIVPDYNPYWPASRLVHSDDFGRFYRHPATVIDRTDGLFDSLFVITNRTRYGRDGTFFPTLGYNRGRLRYGTLAQSTLSDWYYDQGAGLVEIRIAWGLLNVTDPSSATVLFEREGAPLATEHTDGFRAGALSLRKATGQVVGAVPALGPNRRWEASSFHTWRWPTWVEPHSHSRLKPVYDSLAAVWGNP
ncbi:MAG: hypothetical protein ACREMO_13145, partial [Gemmatimonadales bacterium]